MPAATRPPSGAAPLVLVLRGQRRFVTGLRNAEVAALDAPGRFPNGELIAEVPASVRGRACAVVASIAPPPGGIERLTMVAHALRRAGACEVTAVLPYPAYARQDRAEPTQSLGLAWLGGQLRAAGVDRVVCVDVHSDRAAALLEMPARSLPAAPLFAAALPDAWRDGVTFVAPDEGAIERCRALARDAGAGSPIVWLRKRRSREGIEHLGLAGEPAPRAVIVDDILDTGATLVSCCRELRRAGVLEIGIVVTHGLFTGDAWRALLHLGVRRLWVSDTVLARRRPREAVVVPAAPLLARWIAEVTA